MSYIICGYKGVGKSTYAHLWSFGKCLKYNRLKPNPTARIIHNLEDLDIGDLVLEGLKHTYKEDDNSVILLPLNEEVVNVLHENNYPFAIVFPHLRMIHRWETRISVKDMESFETDFIKWKHDRRATVKFIISDPKETALNGWMVDSIILMLKEKIERLKLQ